MIGKKNEYSSIEEQPLVCDEKVSDSLEGLGVERPQMAKVKCTLAAVAMLGCFLTLAHSSRNSSTGTSSAVDILGSPHGHDLKLPTYLTALDESDPQWDEYSSQLTSKYVVGDPGKGNLVPDKVELVRFNEPHLAFRTYGGENKAANVGTGGSLSRQRGQLKPTSITSPSVQSGTMRATSSAAESLKVMSQLLEKGRRWIALRVANNWRRIPRIFR